MSLDDIHVFFKGSNWDSAVLLQHSNEVTIHAETVPSVPVFMFIVHRYHAEVKVKFHGTAFSELCGNLIAKVVSTSLDELTKLTRLNVDQVVRLFVDWLIPVETSILRLTNDERKVSQMEARQHQVVLQHEMPGNFRTLCNFPILDYQEVCAVEKLEELAVFRHLAEGLHKLFDEQHRIREVVPVSKPVVGLVEFCLH